MATLRGHGHDVVLEAPMEQRSVPGGVEFAYHLVVVVKDHAEDIAIDAIIIDLGRLLINPKHRRRRRAQLRDASGKVRDFALGEFVLGEDEDELPPA